MASGIYKITNKLNGHCYIGSSVDIQARWKKHIRELNLNINNSRYLQNAWNKYGADAFEFSVIELCFSFSLISREQHYIDLHHPEYNIATKAGNPGLGLKRSPETLEKMSKALKGKYVGWKHTPEAIAKIAAASKAQKRIIGRKATPETKAKMSLALMGNKNNLGKKASAETRAKLSASLKGNKNSLGRKIPQEVRDKISKAHTGRPKSPETIAKLSEAITSWWKNRKGK